MSEAAVPASAPSGELRDTSTVAPATGGIIVHHLNNSRSQRLLWLLVSRSFYPILVFFLLTRARVQEELEVPYSIKVGLVCTGNAI